MTLQTLINALLTGYAPVARPIAIATTAAALLLPVFYIIARGQAIQRTAAGRGRRRWAIL